MKKLAIIGFLTALVSLSATTPAYAGWFDGKSGGPTFADPNEEADFWSTIMALL